MRALTFIVTDKCNITCDFCAPGCSPSHRDRLTATQMIKVVSDISRASLLRLVVFTGGEPMLYWREVRSVIQAIREKSPMTAIRIVTNASWATTRPKALAILTDLHAAGLTELNYSVDDFHQQHIPEARIVNAVEAASEVGIPVLLAHKTYPRSKSSREYYEALLGRLIKPIDSISDSEFEELGIAISTGYTVPVGRGSDKIVPAEWIPSRYMDSTSTKYVARSWELPCREVLNSFTVSADGKLSPCCGLVDRDVQIFRAGDVINEDAVHVMEKYCSSTIYNWLALDGPVAIRDFINARQYLFDEHAEYVQSCQLCQEIFTNRKALEIILEALPAIGTSLAIKRCALEAQVYTGSIVET